MKKLVLLSLVITLLFIAAMSVHHFRSQESATQPSVLKHVTAGTVGKSPVYQYSLHPGGIHNRAQLSAAMSDPLLASAYQDFNVSKLHAYTLDEDVCVFVSFKKNGRISWTRKCIVQHAGEVIMTDGLHSMLARCGNLISYVPRQPDAPVQDVDLNEIILPVPEAIPPSIDFPDESTSTISSGSIGGAPVIGGELPLYPIGGPMGPISCCGSTPPRHPVQVPAGDGDLLLGTIVILMTALCVKLRKA
jgi:hypothetical protein